MQTEDDEHDENVNSLHRQFYSALNNFHFWQTDRQLIEYDQVLIFRWIRIFNQARSIIISATHGPFPLLDDPTINQMSNLLWTQVLLMKTTAATWLAFSDLSSLGYTHELGKTATFPSLSQRTRERTPPHS
jgi:hypothetical protein